MFTSPFAVLRLNITNTNTIATIISQCILLLRYMVFYWNIGFYWSVQKMITNTEKWFTSKFSPKNWEGGGDSGLKSMGSIPHGSFFSQVSLHVINTGTRLNNLTTCKVRPLPIPRKWGKNPVATKAKSACISNKEKQHNVTKDWVQMMIKGQSPDKIMNKKNIGFYWSVQKMITNTEKWLMGYALNGPTVLPTNWFSIPELCAISLQKSNKYP